MMNSEELLQAVQVLKAQKGLSEEVIFEALEAVLLTAYKRETGAQGNVSVEIDHSTGAYRIRALKEVVDEITEPDTQITLEEANKISTSYAVGDSLYQDVTPKNFWENGGTNCQAGADSAFKRGGTKCSIRRVCTPPRRNDHGTNRSCGH